MITPDSLGIHISLPFSEQETNLWHI